MYSDDEDTKFSPRKSAAWEFVDIENTDRVRTIYGWVDQYIDNCINKSLDLHLDLVTFYSLCFKAQFDNINAVNPQNNRCVSFDRDKVLFFAEVFNLAIKLLDRYRVSQERRRSFLGLRFFY